MNTEQTINLSTLAENPDNPQTVTDEEFARLVESVRTMPETLEASKIAFVTDYVALDGTDCHGKRIVIAGNKRLRALKQIHGENASVPAAWFFDLTPLGEEARRKWLVKSNIQSGEWDAEKLLALYDEQELTDLMGDAALDDLIGSVQETETPGETDPDADGDNSEYQQFVDKFKPKLTTDDCYTPENIYEAVANWAAAKYNLDRSTFVRPFWPGGDYQSFDYPPGCVVVDNPPFSIMSQIIRWFIDHNIAFFLFAPSLTLFSSAAKDARAHHICTSSTITYANGAKVCTAFITSLGEYQIEVAPDLYKILKIEDGKNQTAKELPKYEYPMEVATSARLCWLAKHGTALKIRAADCHFIRRLDAQKDEAIFGGGFLLSERAAAERAAAERAAAERAAAERINTTIYKLSPREIKLQKSLGSNK